MMKYFSNIYLFFFERGKRGRDFIIPAEISSVKNFIAGLTWLKYANRAYEKLSD